MTETKTATEAPTKEEVAFNEAADALAERLIRRELTSTLMLKIEMRVILEQLQAGVPHHQRKSLDDMRRLVKRMLECRYNKYELARCNTNAMRWVLRGLEWDSVRSV